MQRLSRPSSLRNFIPALGLCGLLVSLAPSAQAQQTDGPPTYHPPTSLSDVSGPFLGNVEPGAPSSPIHSVETIRVSITALDTTTRDFVLAPDAGQINLGEVLKVCVHLSGSMDKLSPFAGCSDINWKAYNQAADDAKKLRSELKKSLQNERVALKSGLAPADMQLALRRLALIEKTTTALEATTATLGALEDAMDKAR